jgi:hypothetical protein
MNKKVLTVVLGETRSHELTWTNFKTNVLDHLDSDLAICVGFTEGQETDPFFENAKYVWTYPEQPRTCDGWADAFTNEVCGGNDDWKILLRLKYQLFGGLSGDHDGSGGILLFFRWFLRENLIKNKLVEEYDYFIVTRSDYYWDSPHPNFEDDESIFLPEGESYGGISDRHMVIPRKYILKALDVLYRIVNVPGRTFDAMRTHREWNLEKYLKFHFVAEDIYKHVKWFPRNVYAVRSDTAPTRWAEGNFEPEVNMIVKYPSEYELVKKTRRESSSP